MLVLLVFGVEPDAGTVLGGGIVAVRRGTGVGGVRRRFSCFVFRRHSGRALRGAGSDLKIPGGAARPGRARIAGRRRGGRSQGG